MLNTVWFWIILGYLCGSIPFGLLIGYANGLDIRTQGSKNIGSTNVGRVLGKKWGLLCFGLDVLKGLLPVLLAGWAMGLLGQHDLASADAWCWLSVAGATMLGHIFPVWLKFKGGKGVATGLGAFLGFWPILTIPGLTAFLVWGLLVALFRYVSLASIVGAMLVPVFVALLTLVLHRNFSAVLPFLLTSLLMGVLVVVRHRSNIVRLLKGEENKIGQRAKSQN